MTVPPKDQLTDYDGLDEQYVVKHWSGKSLDDAYKMFADGGSLYCEDITYMSLVALDYYLPAALSYLRSTDSDDDWEIASGVMTSLSCICSRPDLTPTVVYLIRDITNYVAENLAKFDADDDWVPTRINAVRKHIPESGAPSA
ncbi:hypothetical protein CA13_31570 [Planctomycetes bacterium CA13]|uniref:Uncharacterized protein n=1 Tax=Novipirellula herctigrandis TaxID=2527986 RepID=A0A5C5Z360_9BACT|nr:hypothetical protein CA13_31570 [Planctomycetes bacterium CA13]